jgi:hypothetical protein
VPDDTKLVDLARLWGERRAKIDSALHDALRKIGIWLRLPGPMLETATENCATSNSTLHDVSSFIWAIVCTACGVHLARLVPHKNNLTASWVQFAIHHST